MDKLTTINPFNWAPAASSALLTYEPFYGLREKPFSLATDPKFFYKSAAHAGTFEDLFLAIRRREGLIVLTGDIGTGKTTLCKSVLERLDRKTFTTFVPDPFVARDDLLRMMLLDFGVMSVDDLKSGRMAGASRPDLSYPLYDFLKSLVPLQAFAVLIIDEAQNLSPALLEEIRILSDLESPEKLLQVVLIGQLELQAKLKLPEMRQLDQRVSARCSLKPLSRDGVAGYITHRLGVAGGGDDRVHFSPNAVDAVYQVSGGTPRVINLICDRALHRGHLSHKSTVDLDAVAQAIDDLGVGALTAAPSFVPHVATPAPTLAPAALAVTPAAPADKPAAPPARVTIAAAAPVAPPPPTSGSASADLSGLEMHDIEEASPATHAFNLPAYHLNSVFGQRRPRRRWRTHVLRWMASAAVIFAIVFFALFGEAVFIHYFPTVNDVYLRLPDAPAPPRVPAPNSPVPVPADIDPPPTMSDTLRLSTETAPSARR